MCVCHIWAIVVKRSASVESNCEMYNQEADVPCTLSRNEGCTKMLTLEAEAV